MNLTSYRRLLFSLGNNDVLTDALKNKRIYASLIPAISSKIEDYINRKIELTTYTEYADSIPERLEYFVEGMPITSITSVTSDSTGEYNGAESSENNYYIGKDSRSIVLDVPVVPALRGLRFIYTGGLAVHGVNSTYEIENEGATPLVVGNYVEGQDSYAMGYVISKSGTTIVIEVLYGKFTLGEQIKGKTNWDDGAYIANAEADLLSATSLSLAEAYTDIVTACEYEIRYMKDHKSDFENETTSKGQTRRRPRDEMGDYDLLPEIQSMLKKYIVTYI